MAEHTPKPWIFDRPWVNSVEGGPICTINDSNPNRDVDARLIIAAPDLLEALEALVAISRKGKCIEGCVGRITGSCSTLCLKVTAAIAKAKGE